MVPKPLYNYAKYKKLALSNTGGLTQFSDANGISSWAIAALNWSNGNRLVNGHEDTGKIDDQGMATRAQAVSIIRNSNENFVESIQALREGWKRFQPVAVKN